MNTVALVNENTGVLKLVFKKQYHHQLLMSKLFFNNKTNQDTIFFNLNIMTPEREIVLN